MDPILEPVKEGKDLIDRWTRAKQSLERAKRDVTLAEIELSNSTTALGKWMLPSDYKDGEKICIWYGDALLQVEKDKYSDYKISIRSGVAGKVFIR